MPDFFATFKLHNRKFINISENGSRVNFETRLFDACAKFYEKIEIMLKAETKVTDIRI